MADPSYCPFCRRQIEVHIDPRDVDARTVDCRGCGTYIASRLVLAQGNSSHSLPHGYLVSAFIAEASRLDHVPPRFSTAEDIDAALAKCPRTVAEKTERLLFTLAQQTESFGQALNVASNELVKYSYARNIDEARALARVLEERGLLDRSMASLNDEACSVTAAGFDLFESQKTVTPRAVFISSTCYDLLDLRQELAVFLESRGFVVKLSEDPERFAIDPDVDSIETCLRNVENSDIVVCILDRRYGGVIKSGPHAGKSATHVEIEHARALTPRKPVLFYVREKAWHDLDYLRANPGAAVRWVEPDNADSRQKWVEFVQHLRTLPEHGGRSNWMTLFKSSSDLKPLVLRQLTDWIRSGMP